MENGIQSWYYQTGKRNYIFSKKANRINHPPISFNNASIKICSSEKHLGMILDEKLSFKQHLHEKISKAMTVVGTIKKLNSVLSRFSLLTIYKSFARPYLDYGDVIYD